ncbi:MAG: hypothetical protein WC028_11885 [Candidatus Obscuribacterales bacterium]
MPHTDSGVPLSQRYGLPTMGLLWVTMVASFPAVLIGFDWCKRGFSLKQVLLSLLIAIVVLLLYSVPVCLLAVKTGLSFKMLCHKLFPPAFSKILTAALIFLYLGWYSVCALLLADAVAGIFRIQQFLPALALGFCFAMAFNNLFGFKGVANFARFVAAPVVILWICYLFLQVAPDIPQQLSKSRESVELASVICIITQFILGFAIWGNEADYWRNGRGKAAGIAITLAIALMIGEFIFPLVGFLVASKTGVYETGLATDMLNKLVFGSMGWIAVSFLGAQYFAVNDSNLYAFVHGVETFTKLGHRSVVISLAVLAGVLSVFLSISGATSALESMCGLNCTILPTASVLIMAECFIFQSSVVKGANSATGIFPVGKSALIAWTIGAAFGIATSGVVPGTKWLNIGIPALQAWALTLIVYLPLRMMELKHLKRIWSADESCAKAVECITVMPRE